MTVSGRGVDALGPSGGVREGAAADSSGGGYASAAIRDGHEMPDRPNATSKYWSAGRENGLGEAKEAIGNLVVVGTTSI